jgi:hypothetical protein
MFLISAGRRRKGKTPERLKAWNLTLRGFVSNKIDD